MATIAARTTTTSRVLVPKEHGAWAMLLMPCLIATAVAGRVGAESVLFLAAAVSLFAARRPLAMLANRRAHQEQDGRRAAAVWLAAYAVTGLLSILLLLGAYGRWYLLPIGLAALLLAVLQQLLRRARLDRSEAGELLAFAGLAIAGPGAYYSATGRMDEVAGSIWLLSFLYAGASVFYVKLRVRQRAQRAGGLGLVRRFELGLGLAVYQSCSLTLLLALAATNYIPALAPIAFAPLTIKVARDIVFASPQLNLRRLGLIEVGHSVAFATLLVAAYALGPLS